MSFANGRNSGLPLRLIVAGLGSGGLLPIAACWQPGISRAAFAAAEIADRENQPAISRPPKPVAEMISRSLILKDSSLGESILVVKLLRDGANLTLPSTGNIGYGGIEH